MKRAFTLIELLVVISIVSLLASIVLTSVKDARIKSRDATVLELMSGARNTIGLFILSNDSYGPNYNSSFQTPPDTCANTPAGSVWGNPEVRKSLDALKNIAGGVYCATLNNSWELNVPLPSEIGTSGIYACIDSSGTISKKALPVFADGICQ